MVSVGESSVDNTVKPFTVKNIGTEVNRNSYSPRKLQLELSPLSSSATIEKVKSHKQSENACSPISKKDRILQSFAASSPCEENANSILKNRDARHATYCRKRHLENTADCVKKESGLEKRYKNPQLSEEVASDCKWILVGKNGKVLIEAEATKSKIVSY